MRRLQLTIATLLMLAWTLPAFAADGPKSWSSLGLVGQVRTLVEADLADNISPSEPKGTPFHTRTTYFSPDGSAMSFEECVSTCEHTYFLWQAGRLVEEWHDFGNDLPESTVRYVRDTVGRVIEEQELTKSGELECTRRYRRTELEFEESEYCGDILISRRVTKHEKDSDQDQVSLYRYSTDTEREDLETRYEEKPVRLDDGTVKTERRFGRGSTIMVADSRGRILDEVRSFDASYYRETHKFDESGREIEKAEWARDGTNINRRTYTYVCDTHGNWIRRTEHFGSPAYSVPVEGEVTVRTIDYY